MTCVLWMSMSHPEGTLPYTPANFKSYAQRTFRLVVIQEQFYWLGQVCSFGHEHWKDPVYWFAAAENAIDDIKCWVFGVTCTLQSNWKAQWWSKPSALFGSVLGPWCFIHAHMHTLLILSYLTLSLNYFTRCLLISAFYQVKMCSLNHPTFSRRKRKFRKEL